MGGKEAVPELARNRAAIAAAALLPLGLALLLPPGALAGEERSVSERLSSVMAASLPCTAVCTRSCSTRLSSSN
jgi:hypothetical protein